MTYLVLYMVHGTLDGYLHKTFKAWWFLSAPTGLTVDTLYFAHAAYFWVPFDSQNKH